MKIKIMTDNEFKDRIFMNCVNAGVAGLLVFAGSFLNGGVSIQGSVAALAASFVVMLTKFKEFWSTEMGKKGMKGQLFNFF